MLLNQRRWKGPLTPLIAVSGCCNNFFDKGIESFYNGDLNIKLNTLKHATKFLSFIFFASGEIYCFRKLHCHETSSDPAIRIAISTNRRFWIVETAKEVQNTQPLQRVKGTENTLTISSKGWNDHRIRHRRWPSPSAAGRINLPPPVVSPAAAKIF